MTDLQNYKQAVPTEYNGVVFKSKSEAVLARNFDLLDYFWDYEPKAFTQSDLWVPDFWLIRPFSHRFQSEVVEFKPSPPTDTFKDRLATRFDEILRTKTVHSCQLIVGSPFGQLSDMRVFARISDLGEWIEEANTETWLGEINDSLRHRFDLK